MHIKEDNNSFINTVLGTIRISGNSNGISEVSFLEERFDEKILVIDSHIECAKQLNEYFEGKRKTFDFPFAQTGTDFQQRVWKNLLDIPFGETTSYLELSKKIGDVKAIRAVGSANGKNNIAIVIPCHRVIGSNNKLVGYAGGLWRKEWLLKHEMSFSPVKEGMLF
ncbi:MAG: methylated-DNA--[protein]-cysteine S-methyltransferase [Bacteroidota bacterium]|nr:methylated-DNA--[protein]-cysteine S-methyltransferase [Bacteroidota bacterium]